MRLPSPGISTTQPKKSDQAEGDNPAEITIEHHELERLNLHTGESVRIPIGNRPEETLQITATSETPASEKHHLGRTTDVLTDSQGNPRVEQRDSFAHTRQQGNGASGEWAETPPPNWPEGETWPPRDAIRARLASALVQDEIARANRRAGAGRGMGSGGRRGMGSGQVRPAVSGRSSGGASWMDKRARGWF